MDEREFLRRVLQDPKVATVEGVRIEVDGFGCLMIGAGDEMVVVDERERRLFLFALLDVCGEDTAANEVLRSIEGEGSQT